MIGLQFRRVPDGKNRVADDVHDGAVGLVDAADGRLVVGVEQLYQFLRIELLRDAAEARDIAEKDADDLLAPARLAQPRLLQDALHLFRRKIQPQRLLQQPVLHIGAERVVKDGPQQRDGDLRAHRHQPRKPDPLLPEEIVRHPGDNRRTDQLNTVRKQWVKKRESDAEKQSRKYDHQEFRARRKPGEPVMVQQV